MSVLSDKPQSKVSQVKAKWQFKSTLTIQQLTIQLMFICRMVVHHMCCYLSDLPGKTNCFRPKYWCLHWSILGDWLLDTPAPLDYTWLESFLFANLCRETRSVRKWICSMMLRNKITQLFLTVLVQMLITQHILTLISIFTSSCILL